MRLKTLVETGYSDCARDTITIIKDKWKGIVIKSSAFVTGKQLILSKKKALSLAKILMEMAK